MQTLLSINPKKSNIILTNITQNGNNKKIQLVKIGRTLNLNYKSTSPLQILKSIEPEENVIINKKYHPK